MVCAERKAFAGKIYVTMGLCSSGLINNRRKPNQVHRWHKAASEPGLADLLADATNRIADRDGTAVGGTPLEYLPSIIRDESRDPADGSTQRRPQRYVHPKLASVTDRGDELQPVRLVVNGSDLDG
jgi:hypothetical protein